MRIGPIPENTGHSPNAVSMLGQRRRRCANIETALGECPVYTPRIFFKVIRFSVYDFLVNIYYIRQYIKHHLLHSNRLMNQWMNE